MSVLDFDGNAVVWENGTGILSIATDYDGSVFADWDWTNSDAILDTIKAFTFADVGYFENFAPYVKKWDERIIMTDYCDVQEIERKLEKITWFTFDMQEVLEMTNLAQILGATLEQVPAWAWTKWTEIINMKRIMKTQPFQLFKFVSCPDTDGLSNVFYFVKAVFNADITIPYINLSKDDFAWVTFDHEVAKAWNFLIEKEVAVATA